MKSFLEKSKRALVLLLTGAMIATSVPSTVFAAPLADDEDVIFEEGADTVEALGAVEEEELVVEEAVDPVEPDNYTADATITVANYTAPGTDKAGIFTINGSSATMIDDAPISYDSDDSQDVYIVPAMGYSLTASPFTLSVSWTEHGKSATSYANYAAAKTAGLVSDAVAVDVSEAIENQTHGTFDGSKAIKITFPAGSDLTKAFAAKKDATTSYDAGPTVSLGLASGASNQATASTVEVYAYEPGNTTYGSGSLLGTAAYDADWTSDDNGVDVVGSSFDWTGVTAEVGILKGFDAEGKAEWDAKWTVAGSLADMKSAVTASYFMVGGKKLAINDDGVNAAYIKDLEANYELAIVLTRSEEDLSKVHTLSAEASDYYTITSSTLDKTDATTKAKSGKVKQDAGGDVYVKVVATTVTGGARALSKIYYKVGDADAVAMTSSNNITDGDITALNSAEATTYGSTGGATATSDGWRKIAKSAITADTEIFATTTERINFNGIDTTTAVKSTVTVLTANKEALKNEATDISGTITKGATYNNDATATSLTGKPYSFSVVPDTGLEIKEVIARVYGINGVGYDNVDLTGTAVNGVYTIESLTANADIVIKTEELGTKAATIELTANPTGASVALSATGEPISKTDKPSIKTGADVKFAATVLPGYWIKKLEYKVGAAGATETLEPDSISSKGIFSYTIPASKVTGQVNVTITMGDNAKKDSVKITKRTNTNAKITINGTELGDYADSDYMIVPTSAALSFVVEPQGNATTDKVAFQALDPISGTDSITSLTGATTLASGSTTYVITTEQLKAADRDGTKGIALIATTKEEVAAANFTAVWNVTNTSSPNHVDTTKGEVLSTLNLVAGGAAAQTAITKEASKTLKNINVTASDTGSVIFYKADGKTSTGVDAITYKLGITGDNAVAELSGLGITSTKKAGDDVLTAEGKISSAFPHSPVYTATLPVSVAALNTVYDNSGLTLASSIQDRASSKVTTNVEAAGLSKTGKTIREATSLYNDIAVINPQFTDKDKNGVENKNAMLITASSNETLVSSIKWTAVNNSGEEYDPDFLAPTYGLFTGTEYDSSTNAYADTATSSIVLAAGAEAQTVNVTATITYLDNTTSTITDTWTIAPATLGYIAIPTVTVGSMDPVYNGATPTAALELATANGLNTVTVKYDIYEGVNTINPGTPSDWNTKTAADIKAAIDAGKLKAVTTGIDFGEGLKRTSGESTEGIATVSGSGLTYTVTAAKVGSEKFAPDFSVDGIPVNAAEIITEVVSNMPTLTVTLSTGSAPAAYTTDFDAPKLKDSAAWLSKAHGTTIGSSKHTPTAYTYKNVAAGTKVTLPTQEDFEETSYDSKKVLWAWTCGGKGYAPGATVTVAAGTNTFTPVWSSKYIYDSNPAHEGVNVVVGNAKTALTSETEVAIDATVPMFIQFYGLDYDKRAELIEAGSFTGTAVYKTTAETTQEGMELSFTTSSSKASLVESGTAVKGADSAGVDPVLKVEFIEFKGTDYAAKYTPNGTSSTTIKVKAAQTYSITADAITVEENQIKPIDVTVKLTTGGADTALKLDNTSYFSATPSSNLQITGVNESVAKVVVDDTADTSRIKVTGLKAGQSTTATLVLTDKSGTVTSSQPITITVVAATKQIVANRNASSDTAYWDDNAGVLIPVESPASAKTLTLAVKDLGTQAIQAGSGWTVKDSTPSSVPTAKKIYSSVSCSDAGVLSYTAQSGIFGKATIDVAATVSGITYMATLPVTSMYPYTFTYNDANTEVYENDTKATADIVKPIIYTGATTYTVPNSNKITAKWTGSGSPQFLGWTASGSAITNGTVANAAFLAGESFVIKEEDLATTTLHTVFGEAEIAVAGLPAEIVLTDETLATATAAGTDAQLFSVSVTPATSKSPVTINADKKNFLTLNEGDKTKTAAASRTTYIGSNGLTDTSAGVAGSRIINFTVGSTLVPGTGNLIVGYNGRTTKIPVYVNGEYKDTTVTPNADRYLEKGEVLVEGVRTVNGEKHYYKDSARVMKGAVKTEDGKTVLIVAGKLHTTVGAIAIDDKVYYVGTDGFVKTNGLFTGEAAGDKTKTYYANEDGTLAAGELKEVSGKTYYFNMKGDLEKAASTADTFALSSDGKYYVDAEGNVAIAGIFKTAGVDRLFREDGKIVAYTDADVTEGKITVKGIKYIIDKDTNAATRDDVFYNAKVNWVDKFPSKWSKTDAIPTITYTITYTSANTGETTTTTEKATAVVTPATVAAEAVDVTFTATADLTGYFADAAGTTPATADPLTITYKFKNGGSEGLSDITYAPSVAWTTKWPSKWSKSEALPSMKYKVTYTSKESGTQVTTEELTATITPATVASDATEVTFEAVADLSSYFTDETGATAVDPAKIANSTTSKTYKFKKGGEEGKTGGDPDSETGEISVAFVVDPETDTDGNPVFVETGAAIRPAVVVRDEDRDVTLAQGVDYTLSYSNNKKVGSATITVKGKGNYVGQTVTLGFKIAKLTQVDSGFAVKSIKSFTGFVSDSVTEAVTGATYNGEAWMPAVITVKDADGAEVALKLQSDGTYATEDGKTTAINVVNNVNKGSATVSALNAKDTVVKKSFKIAPVDLSQVATDALTSDPDDAVWAAKGAVPANLNVEYNGMELVLGQDYTVKYSYAANKNAGEKAGSFVITGKGNFSKKFATAQTFDITALELTEDAVSVSAFAGTTVKKVLPTVSDGNGAKIAPKALSVTVVKEGETTALDAKTKLQANDKITVTVKGVNETNISGSVDIDITVAANLGKAKVVSTGVTKYYTGEPVELTDEDMAKISVTIKNGPAIEYGTDYEIAGYQNNVKKGSMLVTIRGISDKCSGTKTFKVKIAPKTMKKAD